MSHRRDPGTTHRPNGRALPSRGHLTALGQHGPDGSEFGTDRTKLGKLEPHQCQLSISLGKLGAQLRVQALDGSERDTIGILLSDADLVLPEPECRTKVLGGGPVVADVRVPAPRDASCEAPPPTVLFEPEA